MFIKMQDLTEKIEVVVFPSLYTKVPEIFEGIVEIKSISREAGSRSKIAVHSNDEEVDPMGACVGPKGVRVQSIVNELKNEKIDIIKWSKEINLCLLLLAFLQ